MSTNYGWFAWALLSAVFAALTAIFAKLGIRNIDSDLLTFYRTWIVILLLVAIITYSGKWASPLALSPHTWFYIVLSGLATGLSWICYFRALKIGNVSQVAPVDKFSVVLAAILALTFLGERPSIKDWTGILLITSGVVLLAIKR